MHQENASDGKRWMRIGSDLVRIFFRWLGVFLLGSLLVFLAVRSMPGDPVALRVKNPDPERVAEIRAELGLDDPWWEQYGRFVADFVSGDWGRSLISGRDVFGEIRNYLPATLELGILATLWGTLMGILLVLGSEACGWRPLRRVAAGLGALGLTVPIFWIGLLFAVIFAVQLKWLPVSGRYDFTLVEPSGTGFYLIDTILVGGDAFGTALSHLILPVITLSLYPAALVAGTLRARLDDARIRMLIVALSAKGVSSLRIWGIHILRLMAAPVITVIGTNFGALIGGAVLTETVFSWPGMGRFLVDGVLNRDLFVISNGLLLVILLAFLVVSLADVGARWSNPVGLKRKGVDAR